MPDQTGIVCTIFEERDEKEQKETLSIIMKAYDKAMIERATKMKDFLTLMPEEQTERQNEFQSLSEWIARYHASKKQWENHA